MARSTRFFSISRGLVVCTLAAALVPGVATVTPAFGADAPIDPGARLVEFELPNRGSLPNDVEAGADGSIWVSAYTDRQVIKLDRTSSVVMTAQLTGSPTSLSTDGEGGVWAAEYASNAIAHVSAAGAMKEYPIPTPNSFPAAVYDGGDQVYFTESDAQQLGRLTESTGHIDEYPISGAVTPWDVDGFDGEVWVTDANAERTQIFNRDGVVVSMFRRSSDFKFIDLLRSEDGWISGIGASESVVSEFDHIPGIDRSTDLANGRADIQGIAAQGSAVWYVDAGTNTIGQNGWGPGTEYSVPTAGSGLAGITITEGRFVWVAEKLSGKVARLDTRVAMAVDRIGGADRFEVAANVSHLYGAPRPIVFIASGQKFADALSAGPIAAARAAPLLLTAADALPEATRNELIRLDPQRVVIVGGPASISPATADAIRAALPKSRIDRIDGVDRYAVSRALLASDLAPTTGSRLYVANGQNFPDALSSGPAAARFHSAILLVNGPSATLTSDELSVIQRFSGDGESVKIAGGPASVSPAIEAQIASVASVQRFGGADRFEVSQAINDDAFPRPTGGYIASGATFPDALAGGAIAGQSDGQPLYLAHTDCIPSGVLHSLTAGGARSVHILGGPVTLKPPVEALTEC